MAEPTSALGDKTRKILNLLMQARIVAMGIKEITDCFDDPDLQELVNNGILMLTQSYQQFEDVLTTETDRGT